MPLKGGSKMTNYILSFGAGLAVGIGATYIYMKQKYEEKLSEQIQEVRKHYQKKRERSKPKKEKDEKFANRFEEAEERGKDRIAYESIAKRYQGSVEQRPVDPAEQESPSEDEPEEELFIVPEEKLEIYDNFEEISLTYYAEDDILCDDQEQVIEDPEAIIGDALTKFGVKSGYPDTVYVINKRVRAIFEILMVEGSYQEIVLGMKNDEER